MTQKAPLSNLNPNLVKFLVHLFKRQISNFYIIFGRRGSGKTAFALFICEVLFYTGTIKHFATNTLIYNSPFPFERITNLEDLRDWGQETKGKKLFMLDEVGKTVKRRSPMKTLNVELINDLQTIRKHKLSLLATTIEESNTDKAILSPAVLDGVWIKPSYKNKKIARFVDRLEHKSKRWYGIPKTSIRFDTWDSAPFKMHRDKTKIPAFQDGDKEKAWRLIRGETADQVGLQYQQIARLWRRLLKGYLEEEASRLTHKRERA